jgi:polyphosphate kinase
MAKNEIKYTQNRDISWLRFNERVLEEALDKSVPIFERLKFLSIFSTNLDEFFMIRIGSLIDIVSFNPDYEDWRTGKLMSDQIKLNYKFANKLINKRDRIYHQCIDELSLMGLKEVKYKNLNKDDKKNFNEHFENEIMPLLAPQVIDEHHPFPHLPNKLIHVGAVLKTGGNLSFGLIPIPQGYPEIIFLPYKKTFIQTSELILNNSEQVFKNYKIEDAFAFNVIRNADINLAEDYADDTKTLKTKMQELLAKRKRLSVDLIEHNHEIPKIFKEFLKKKLSLKNYQFILTKAPINLSKFYTQIENDFKNIVSKYQYPKHEPQYPIDLVADKPMIEQIRQKDVLLFFPYHSFTPFLDLIKQAANDPRVKSIKITIYRLSKNSRLVDYLSRAAENGKEVTVIIELRARFDEQNNIDFSERLENAGCRIIYGVRKYKVHSKICLITYVENNKVNYITQVGTGNYNEKTVELYSDLSIITANQEIGKDAFKFFNSLLLNSIKEDYTQLLVAPVNLKSKIIDLIEQETLKKDKGLIKMKLNSITDQEVISALGKASKAGVKIKMQVRSSCCIVPKIENETSNIEIINIVGQFLEHSRIYSFGTGNEQKIYIGSADMMSRNTGRRVEVLIPLLDKEMVERVDKIFETYFKDNIKIRYMNNLGEWISVKNSDYPFSAQEHFKNKK